MPRPARPRKRYSKKLAAKLPEMFDDGKTVAAVCQELGIGRSTFYEWVEKHEDFRLAYEEGRFRSEAWWTERGRLGAIGKEKLVVAAWIFNMKNRFGWRDHQQDELPEDISPEEYARRAQAAFDKMRGLDAGAGEAE